jgi:DNA repair protein RadC
VFRAAIITAAAAVDAQSSGAIPLRRKLQSHPDLIRAGQLLKIEVLDHVILGWDDTHRFAPWVTSPSNDRQV